MRLSNEAPEFAEAAEGEGTYVRAVTETAAAGQLVGDPVTADDDNADDVLTYTLDDDSNNFVIDRATGQISVAKGAKLNVMTDDDIDNVAGVDSYDVVVIATDPKGTPTDGGGEDTTNDPFRDTVIVVITVTDVDEPPIFTTPELLPGETSFSVSFGEGGGIATELATFVANDPEPEGAGGDPTTLGIRGADSSKFTFTGGVLTFKAAPAAAPNFEKPADADKDNVYEVTITAADVNANMATRDVKVTVTNAEELGEVTLSQTRPRVGLAITASYSDPRRRVGQRHVAVVEDRFQYRHRPSRTR